MGSAHGTTDKTAAAFVATSTKSRPATDGNKSVNMTARRKSAESMVPANRTAPLVGPDKGTG